MITLASQSASRRAILTGAGVAFEAVSPGVDEDAVKAGLLAEGAGPREVADALAELKAVKVSRGRPGLVIGADQTLDLDGELFDKAATVDEARARLRSFRGRRHRLHAAVVVATGGLASVVAPESNVIEHVDEDLTLRGLRLVWERGQ